ncbi:unnamed protein product, partial [marine sediment metagenome]
EQGDIKPWEQGPAWPSGFSGIETPSCNLFPDIQDQNAPLGP